MTKNPIRKFILATTKPTRFRNYLFWYLNNYSLKIYNWIFIILDRVLCILFIPVVDLLYFLIKDQRRNVKIQICRYFYYSEQGNTESQEKYFLDDTISEFLMPDNKFLTFYWDKGQPLLATSLYFYAYTIYHNPSILLISSYSTNVFYQPPAWILERIRGRGIKVKALWWDTCSDTFAAHAYELNKCIDVHGVMDNPTLNFGNSKEALLLKNTSKVLFCPYKILMQSYEKDINVIFIGQTNSYRDIRNEYIEYLKINNIAFYSSTHERTKQLPHEDYYKLMFRSKIGINFSSSVDKHQLKGRVAETMLTGCLLVEERNEQTSHLFSEGEDYVAFSTKEELIEKIKYYQINENERKKIAESGRRKAQLLFNGRQFWDTILL